MSGVKFDSQKPRMDLLSSSALEGLAQVLTFGASKYAAHNWRQGMDWSRVVAAAYRHLAAFNRGEDFDRESGLPHIDHLACCVMFLSEFQKTKNGRDDRFRESSIQHLCKLCEDAFEARGFMRKNCSDCVPPRQELGADEPNTEKEGP